MAEPVAVTMDELKKWPVIYPVYLDKDITRAQGRRVAKEDGVSFPNVAEIVECTKKMGLVYILEDKRHPKSFDMRARIRVRLFHPDGKAPLAPEVAKTKLEFLKKLCELIPGCDARALVEKRIESTNKKTQAEYKNIKSKLEKKGIHDLQLPGLSKGQKGSSSEERNKPGKHKLRQKKK